MTHPHRIPLDDLPAARHRQAEGGLCAETATMVLVGHRSWLLRDDFVARFIETFPALVDNTPMAVIDFDAALAAIDTGRLVSSTSEEQILRIAASLATGAPVDLSAVLTGHDDHNLGIVIAALAHPAGARSQHPPTPNLVVSRYPSR